MLRKIVKFIFVIALFSSSTVTVANPDFIDGDLYDKLISYLDSTHLPRATISPSGNFTDATSATEKLDILFYSLAAQLPKSFSETAYEIYFHNKGINTDGISVRATNLGQSWSDIEVSAHDSFSIVITDIVRGNPGLFKLAKIMSIYRLSHLLSAYDHLKQREYRADIRNIDLASKMLSWVLEIQSLEVLGAHVWSQLWNEDQWESDLPTATEVSLASSSFSYPDDFSARHYFATQLNTALFLGMPLEEQATLGEELGDILLETPAISTFSAEEAQKQRLMKFQEDKLDLSELFREATRWRGAGDNISYNALKQLIQAGQPASYCQSIFASTNDVDPEKE